MDANAAQDTTAGRAGRSQEGVTERGWWAASKETWTNPREWTVWNVLALGSLVLLLAGMAYWVTRPGSPLGAAEPLNATSLYVDNTTGRYVYELMELPAGNQSRARAMLQTIYDAHKSGAEGEAISIVVVRRNTDPAPYVVGTGDPAGEGVVAYAVRGPDRREAAVRRAIDRPLEKVDLRW